MNYNSYFDIKLIYSIVSDIEDIDGLNVIEKTTFWGYKEKSISQYYLFFFTMMNGFLTFKFRIDNFVNQVVLYVTNDNIDQIQSIIRLLLADKKVDESIYDNEFLYMKTNKKNNEEKILSNINEDKYLEHKLKRMDYKEKIQLTRDKGFIFCYEKWTKEETDKLVEEYNQGLSINEISSYHGRTVGAIRRRLEKIGLIDQQKRVVCKSTEDEKNENDAKVKRKDFKVYKDNKYTMYYRNYMANHDNIIDDDNEKIQENDDEIQIEDRKEIKKAYLNLFKKIIEDRKK